VVYNTIIGEKLHQKTLSNGKEDSFHPINSKIVFPSEFNLHKKSAKMIFIGLPVLTVPPNSWDKTFSVSEWNHDIY